MKQQQNIISWIAQIVAALILAQTLFFKFSGATESMDLFTKLGIEPYGRYLAGTMELMTVILLLIPKKAWIGAALGTFVMIGAIFSHLLVLGVESEGDGGYLFLLATITLICCLTVLYIHKREAVIFVKITF